MRRKTLIVRQLLLVGLLWMMSPIGRAEPPNVLFLSIDDLNDWVGCLGGHPQAVTPNIDRLAARGLLFANAHVPAPACNPSRTAILTGIRPSTSGVYHNHQPWQQSPVLRDAVTLPEHFMAHGYQSIRAGKVFHSKVAPLPFWDVHFPSSQHFKPPDPFRHRDLHLNSIPDAGAFDWGSVEVEPNQMGDWQLAEWVADQLRQPHQQPFFLAAGTTQPHLEWYIPASYFEALPLKDILLPETIENDLEDISPWVVKRIARPDQYHAMVLEHDEWRRAVQAYLAAIRFIDDCVGVILDGLDAGPHRDNTFVILWSDHGHHLGEKEHWHKYSLWEEATRVPLMIAGPGIAPGGVCSQPVNLVDLYATLSQLCELPDRPGLDSASLIDLIRDPDAPGDRYALITHGRGNHAVRTDRWRYISYAEGSEELYDHDADPNEWHNLAADPDQMEVLRELRGYRPSRNAEDSLSTRPGWKQNGKKWQSRWRGLKRKLFGP